MQKVHIDATIDADVYNIVKMKYCVKGQLSNTINNFLRNLIDFENPEEEELKQEPTIFKNQKPTIAEKVTEKVFEKTKK